MLLQELLDLVEVDGIFVDIVAVLVFGQCDFPLFGTPPHSLHQAWVLFCKPCASGIFLVFHALLRHADIIGNFLLQRLSEPVGIL